MPRPKKSNRADGRYELRKTIGQTAEGKTIRKSFYGKDSADAEQKYHTFLLDLKKKEEEKKSILFSSWANRWLYEYKQPDVKPTTFLTTYERPCKNYIIPFFEKYILQEITPLDIKRFTNTLLHRSQSLIDKIIICLRGIFETAIDNDLITKNPCRNIKARSKVQKAKKRTYDRETAEALCSAKCKYSLYVHILLAMGLRCSELCGLMWEDIDLEHGVMHIERALTTESGGIYISNPKSFTSRRTLKIPQQLLERLKSEKGTGFIAMKGKHHVTPDHFAERELEVFYNALAVPREKRLSSHELRHTCGTLLYQETKDIYHVSKFLGHSDIGITTKTYVHTEMQQAPIHIDF